MSKRFIPCDREQILLLPPCLLEWLPQDHLAFFVIDAVAQMDLDPFYAKYQSSNLGRPAYEPSMLLALLIYAYSKGIASSRKIESACVDQVPFRVISANKTPDHVTIATFRKDHEAEFKSVFVDVLRLCAEAGLVKVGRVALDGTKVRGNASLAANKNAKALQKEVDALLAEAAETDQREDDEFGKDRRGDEPPASMRSREDRLRRLRECKARLDAEAKKAAEDQQAKVDAREAEENETGRKKRGRKPKSAEDARKEKEGAKANATDPDSRILKTRGGYCQGYNAQAVATEDQVIVAAEVTQQENDVRQLQPMLDETKAMCTAAGIKKSVGSCSADAGYWSEENLRQADGVEGPELFIATTKDWKERKALREAPPPKGRIPRGLSGKQRMERKLRTARGRATYKKRSQTIEPVFGQIKARSDRFMRRGLEACRSEWFLLCASHNLLKLWRKGGLRTA